LPEWLGNLCGLHYINIGRNQLKELPVEFCELKKLSYIFASGNNFPEALAMAIDKGARELREYLRQQKDQGTAPLYEAKLLIVGEPGAGKTTLMRKLLDPNHPVPNESDKSTVGINVEEGIPFPWEGDRSIEFNYNIWDFGGQEIQFLTHQFFLTGRSLYVLVSDNRKLDTDFDYWFHIVSLLGEASPMLVVCNAHPENPNARFPESEYRKNFPELKPEKIEVDFAKQDARQTFLYARIKEKLSRLKHVGEQLPAGWPKVRKAIRELLQQKTPCNYITFEKFQDICCQHEIRREADQLQLSSYLHDLGVVLHFQEDASLLGTLFLNPKWVTDAMYRVFRDEEGECLLLKNGRFCRDALFSHWEQSGYTHKERLMLLSLMEREKFDVCYPLKGSDEQEYIVPLRLSEDPPLFEFDKEDCLEFQYHYDFLPRGFVQRLLVHMSDMIAQNGDTDLVWQKGYVLEKEQNRALVQEEIIEGIKAVTIKVDGPADTRKNLLIRVREEIKRLHRGRIYRKAQFREMIPCCGPVCSEKSVPKFFKLSELKGYLKSDWYSIKCEKCKQEILLSDLFGNVADTSMVTPQQMGLHIFDDRKIFERERGRLELFSPEGAKELLERDGSDFCLSVDQLLQIIKALPTTIVQNVAQSHADASAESSAVATAKVSIEIKNQSVVNLKSTLDYLEDDLDELPNEEEQALIRKELKRLVKPLDNLHKMECPKEAKESPALARLQKFIGKLDDTTSNVGKIFRKLENGIDTAQQIGKFYNGIAEWCGMPVVPKVFLGKE
ncbi:MAG: hypothetical protein KAT62_00850, partial [Desulfuromonadales bacterium]|nr:hypothetical protein [Desulfuromonadales bacterium]